MTLLRNWLRHYRKGRHLRPWALFAPIVVLLIALPLLRPLRHPDSRQISDDELARLATVQALIEHKTQAIDATGFANTRAKVQRGEHSYSDQPPTMAVLLAGSYWTMRRAGFTFDSHPHWVTYVLTVLGATLPVAGAAGLIYRMGRLFELHRAWRACLALAAVLGSGLISYATVLNAHAPAAALVLGSAACLIHVTITRERLHSSVWLLLAGVCAALAGALDLSAGVFLVLFVPVILALRWRPWQRVAGVLIYLLGAAGPVMLHASLTRHATGDFWQGAPFRADQAASRLSPSAAAAADAAAEGSGGMTSDAAGFEDYEDDEPRTLWRSLWVGFAGVAAAFFGPHGVLSHFPVVLVGVLGVTMVMHRHWPSTTKVLAGATLAGGAWIVLLYASRLTDWRDAMFASRWFIAFLPLTVFWAGVWLRRHHRPLSWAAAGLLLAFSVSVSLLGATGPLPRDGFGRYTAAAAARNLLRPPDLDAAPILADAVSGDGPSITP